MNHILFTIIFVVFYGLGVSAQELILQPGLYAESPKIYKDYENLKIYGGASININYNLKKLGVKYVGGNAAIQYDGFNGATFSTGVYVRLNLIADNVHVDLFPPMFSTRLNTNLFNTPFGLEVNVRMWNGLNVAFRNMFYNNGLIRRLTMRYDLPLN